MGCDGGTIPKRDELVRTKKKPEQVDKNAEAVAKWKHCALSQNELRQPIVACDLGRIYNKTSVIEHLLDKTKFGELAQHIRSLKDVFELKLTDNPAFNRRSAEKGDGYVDLQSSKFICPVVGMEMNGKHKFVYLRGCCCVLSERALKTVKSDVCHKCGKTYSPEDIVTINGSDEEVVELRRQMEERRVKDKLEKKAKKKKASTSNVSSTEEEPVFKKPHIQASVTAVVANGTSSEGPSKSKLISQADTSASSSKPRSLSISKDPSKSEAFKSLFTSHESHKQQPKAHWITFNPLYY